jgi:hypothetical protein
MGAFLAVPGPERAGNDPPLIVGSDGRDGNHAD